MEQNSFIAFADVKASLFDPEILTLLAPSVYNPTPERLKRRAENTQRTKNLMYMPAKLTVCTSVLLCSKLKTAPPRFWILP